MSVLLLLCISRQKCSVPMAVEIMNEEYNGTKKNEEREKEKQTD